MKDPFIFGGEETRRRRLAAAGLRSGQCKIIYNK